MTELEDKFAIITGAGSGMARASTRVFVREGARVLAADISGRQEAAELCDAVVPFHCDVTKEDEVRGLDIRAPLRSTAQTLTANGNSLLFLRRSEDTVHYDDHVLRVANLGHRFSR
jgi:short chain dehydrogenase